MTNLVVGVMGHRNSGKSTTWNTLFNRTVRTGKHPHELQLNDSEYVKVFLLSGSPEERQQYVADLIKGRPRIVLCSMQYTIEVIDTFDYFAQNNYFQYIQWLNPGFHDVVAYSDYLELVPRILSLESVIGQRDGQEPITETERVEELRNYIRDWADHQGLIRRY